MHVYAGDEIYTILKCTLRVYDNNTHSRRLKYGFYRSKHDCQDS
jgi:hypothetical protein